MTNTRIRVLRLCRTRYISYTVVSDIEGATVLFDNEDVGTIQNGSFTIRIKEEEDTGNHTVLLQNGTLKQKENSYQFEYSQSKNLPNIGASGVNISEYFNVTSNKTSYTPKYPEQSNVTKETRIVIMNTEYDESTSSIPFSSTTFDFETNHTLEDNVVDIKITQSESNKELTLKGVQDAGIQYQYTVNSDIEGATCQLYDSDIEIDSKTIVSGKCIFTLWHDIAKDSMVVKLSGDKSLLPTDEETYLFKNNSGIVNFPGVGGTFNISEHYEIQSSFSSVTYQYPENKTINRNETITMDSKAVEQGGVQKSYTPSQIQLEPTEKQKEGSITITQEESGKELILKYTQIAMVYYDYTVNSDSEGANVYFDGNLEGSISNGTFTARKYENVAKESYNVTLEGGTIPETETDYVFTVSPTSLTGFNDKGETRNVTITSTKTVTTYSNSSGTVGKNKTVTLNIVSTPKTTNLTYTSSVSGTGISVSGNKITYAANPDKQQRSGSVTFTQAESNKKATVSCSQNAKVSYTYTINSNCNGGTVYFNNVSKGTISGGKLVFEDDAASGTVRISGGVPSTTQEFVRNNTSTDYDFSSNETDFSWGDGGGTKTATVDSSKKVTTTPVYRDKSYSAPANKTVNGDTSVTMNYSGPNYSSEYNGSPQEGSWTRVNTSWQYDDPSWVSKSKSNYSSYQTKWTFNCDSNGGSSRSDYDNLIQAETGDKIRFNFSQSAYVPPAPTYTFKWKSTTSTTLNETADKFLANGKTYGTNPNMSYIQNPFYSKKNGSKYTSVNVVAESGGASGSVGSFGGTGDLDLRISMSKNTSKAKRTGKVDIKQSNGSSTTLRMTVEQTYIHFRITEGTEDNLNWEFPSGGSQSGGDHALNIWPPLQEYGAPSQYWPSATVSGVPSWMTVNKTSGIKNGTQVVFQCQANNTGSKRTATVTLTEDHCGIQRRINFSQPGSSFSVTYNGTAHTSDFTMNAWSDGLAGSPQVKVSGAYTASVISKPSTTIISSINVTSSGAAGSYCTIAPASNTTFKNQTFKVRITPKNGGNPITITCNMGGRKNQILVKASRTDTYYFFNSAPTSSTLYYDSYYLRSGQTSYVGVINKGGSISGTQLIFNPDTDKFNTKKNIMVYRKDGSNWIRVTTLYTDSITVNNI